MANGTKGEILGKPTRRLVTGTGEVTVEACTISNDHHATRGRNWRIVAAGSESFRARVQIRAREQKPKISLRAQRLTVQIKPPAQPRLPAPLGLYLAFVGTRRLF